MAIVTVLLGEQTVSTHTVSHHPFTVGRDAACDVCIDNLGISRNHCKFAWADGKFRVEDAGSANGTFLNGEKVASAEVKDGDEVRIGKYRLVFHQAAGEPAPPQKGEASSLAQMLGTAAPEKRVSSPDDGKTYVGAPAVGPRPAPAAGQRAAEVASSQAAREAPSARAGMSRRTVLVVIAVNAVVILGLAAALVYFLMTKG